MESIFEKSGFIFVCKSESTRYGFRHLCTAFRDGQPIKKEKCCYYNRTWESFDFESVLNKACAALGVAPFTSPQG